MVFQNIEFHNVHEIEETELGYKLWRLPKSVRERVNEGIADRTAAYSTGVELRFKINGESADIYLRASEEEEAQVAYICYGSIQGGWRTSSKVIGTEVTKITIAAPDNMERLKEITNEHGLPFNPEVVRIILPYGTCRFIKAEGDIAPPEKADLPTRTYLAYGSSITHGALALAPPYSYPFRIAQILNCDYINMGFAGTAHLEKEMAEYIVSRTDWDFASVEMGINLVDIISEEEFESRVREFVSVLAQDKRPIFATSIFTTARRVDREMRFREIVKKYAQNVLIFTDGTDLLAEEKYVSQDLVHPSLEGIEIIANKWSEIMKKKL